MKKPSNQFFLKKYTKSQQRGILFLLILLIGSVGYNYYYFNYLLDNSTSISYDEDLLLRFNSSVDSIRLAREEARKTKPKSVKINFISEYNAYKIGLSPSEYDAIIDYNQSGKWIDSKATLASITGMSLSKLDSIHTFLIYPQYKNNFQSTPSNSKVSSLPKKDLNLASAEELGTIKGIGEVLSDRIIKYRTKMGGFRDELQLKEIYGLKYDVYKSLVETFELRNKTDFEKLDLKQASLLELTEIPYFNYELARNIKRFVDLREGDVDFDDLIKINDFPTSKLEGIKLYLEIND